jgi:hypothetical protein
MQLHADEKRSGKSPPAMSFYQFCLHLLCRRACVEIKLKLKARAGQAIISFTYSTLSPLHRLWVQARCGPMKPQVMLCYNVQ